MRTLKDTCGLSVNLTLRVEFSLVKAGTWVLQPKDRPTSDAESWCQVDQADVVGGDPEENPGSPLVIWILHIGGP